MRQSKTLGSKNIMEIVSKHPYKMTVHMQKQERPHRPNTVGYKPSSYSVVGFFPFRLGLSSTGSAKPSPRIQANAFLIPGPATAVGRLSKIAPISAHDATSTHNSPPLYPRQIFRLTPTFHAETTASRKKYKKWERCPPPFSNTNGRPLRAPLR